MIQSEIPLDTRFPKTTSGQGSNLPQMYLVSKFLVYQAAVMLCRSLEMESLKGTVHLVYKAELRCKTLLNNKAVRTFLRWVYCVSSRNLKTVLLYGNICFP